MTNGMPKTKVQSIVLRLETTCAVEVSERAWTVFSSTTMNERKAETITIEDESQSEDDNSEELYQPVFMRTEETCASFEQY